LQKRAIKYALLYVKIVGYAYLQSVEKQKSYTNNEEIGVLSFSQTHSEAT
jgi:hypothetical protein